MMNAEAFFWDGDIAEMGNINMAGRCPLDVRGCGSYKYGGALPLGLMG
jgi:hypothetical protein